MDKKIFKDDRFFVAGASEWLAALYVEVLAKMDMEI